MEKVTTNILSVIQKSCDSSLKIIGWLDKKTQAALPVLNGIIGDTLAKQNSSFSLDMGLLGKVKGRKICILIHGLCDSESSWAFPHDPDSNYGVLLEKDLGYTPLLVRYNSGLHISTNGQKLNQLLSQAWQKSFYGKREIVLIGHSMGGLVIRSACYYGQLTKAPWVKQIKKIFLLGTPHLGVDLERIGHLTSVVLHRVPNLITKGLAYLGNKRSAGIKDLRFGYLLDEDWQGQQDQALWHDNRHPVPLLEGVDYYIIAASLAKESKNMISEYFGDGLVPARSATGKSFFKSKTIPFPSKHFKVLKGLSHRELARHPEVYQCIKRQCS